MINNMNIIITIAVFCMVLFIYLHIYFQLNTSNDLELYEIEKPSKERLEEICDLKQPIIFDYQNEKINEICNLNYINKNYGAFDVKIRNLQINDDESELYIPIKLNAAMQLFKNDNEKKYISEKNYEFLDETGLLKCYKYNDAFLRPYAVSSCDYDIITASNKITTPFKYDLNYRNYYLVTQGSIKVIMSPPKSKKYLYEYKDYENLEFTSPINPWDIQPQYKPDFDKIKCLEIELKPGSILFIPAFWWYSFSFINNASLCTFKYRTYMNTFANIPKYALNLLQTQNIKRNVIRRINNDITTILPKENTESNKSDNASNNI
jgi:hypothetical protein